MTNKQHEASQEEIKIIIEEVNSEMKNINENQVNVYNLIFNRNESLIAQIKRLEGLKELIVNALETKKEEHENIKKILNFIGSL